MEEQTNNLPVQAKQPVDLLTLPNMEVTLDTSHGFAIAQRIAGMLAKSTLVPPTYQGNLSNCILALNMAYRMKADPLMVIQNLYIVYGRPGWSSQFLIATFNKSGKFSALRYGFVGTRGQDDWGCYAYATELATNEVLEGTTVTIATAKAEKWYDKKDSKWLTMPEQMLRYRAASWFIRAYAPEIAMGLLTAEEVHDTYDAKQAKDGTCSVELNDLIPEPVATPAPVVVDVVPTVPTTPEPVAADPVPQAEPEKMPEPAPTPAPEVEPPFPTTEEKEKKNGKRPSGAEMDAMRDSVERAVLEAGLKLIDVEKAVGEFKNRWSAVDCAKIRGMIIPALKAEKAKGE